MTCLPIWLGSLWVRVTPSSVYTMMASTPAAFRPPRHPVAAPVGSGLFRASTIPGACAKVCAVASVLCSASAMLSRRAWITRATSAAATSSATTSNCRRKTWPARLRMFSTGCRLGVATISV